MCELDTRCRLQLRAQHLQGQLPKVQDHLPGLQARLHVSLCAVCALGESRDTARRAAAVVGPQQLLLRDHRRTSVQGQVSTRLLASRCHLTTLQERRADCDASSQSVLLREPRCGCVSNVIIKQIGLFCCFEGLVVWAGSWSCSPKCAPTQIIGRFVFLAGSSHGKACNAFDDLVFNEPLGAEAGCAFTLALFALAPAWRRSSTATHTSSALD